jgi:hypothetical protein
MTSLHVLFQVFKTAQKIKPRPQPAPRLDVIYEGSLDILDPKADINLGLQRKPYGQEKDNESEVNSVSLRKTMYDLEKPRRTSIDDSMIDSVSQRKPYDLENPDKESSGDSVSLRTTHHQDNPRRESMVDSVSQRKPYDLEKQDKEFDGDSVSLRNTHHRENPRHESMVDSLVYSASQHKLEDQDKESDGDSVSLRKTNYLENPRRESMVDSLVYSTASHHKLYELEDSEVDHLEIPRRKSLASAGSFVDSISQDKPHHLEIPRRKSLASAVSFVDSISKRQHKDIQNADGASENDASLSHMPHGQGSKGHDLNTLCGPEVRAKPEGLQSAANAPAELKLDQNKNAARASINLAVPVKGLGHESSPSIISSAPSSYISRITEMSRKRWRSSSVSSRKVPESHKALKGLLIVVVAYFICMTPFSVTKLIKVVVPRESVVPGYANIVATVFQYLASAVNPLIYGLFRQDFQQAFSYLFWCSMRRRGHTRESKSRSIASNSTTNL